MDTDDWTAARLLAYRQRLDDEFARHVPNVEQVIFLPATAALDDGPPVGLLIIVQHGVGLVRPLWYN